jgi:hypothetical protein
MDYRTGQQFFCFCTKSGGWARTERERSRARDEIFGPSRSKEHNSRFARRLHVRTNAPEAYAGAPVGELARIAPLQKYKREQPIFLRMRCKRLSACGLALKIGSRSPENSESRTRRRRTSQGRYARRPRLASTGAHAACPTKPWRSLVSRVILSARTASDCTGLLGMQSVDASRTDVSTDIELFKPDRMRK